MSEERTSTHNSYWFPRSIDVRDNKICFEGGSWESTWTTEGTMVRNNNSANSMETDYRNALDRAANEDYPGYPMPTYYRQRIMDQLISRPRIFAYPDTLSALENTRVSICFDSMEIVDGLGEFDGWFRGIDVNTTASAAGDGGGNGDGDDADEDDDDDDKAGDYVVSL